MLTAVDELGLRQLVLSNHVWELPDICRAHGWLPPLTDVLTSARLGVEKPHPESYAAAIAAAGCAPGEILFVGDTYEADVAGPERAGMQALLVRRPHPDARRYADDLTGVLRPAPSRGNRPYHGRRGRPRGHPARADRHRRRRRARRPCSRPARSRAGRARDVLLKAENLQRTGAFKLRGAVNRMSTLSDDERARGVVAASAGNHAQGVALAATALGVSSRVYMPVDAPLAKQVATADYGAEVVLAGETFEESYAAARDDPDGRILVPPFDDAAIIAGQGTIGLELLEQAPEADTIVVPLGGGGLLSGIAVAVKALRPDVRVIGVQAAGCASWTPSLAAGHPVDIERVTTVADGIAVQRPGDLTFPLVQRFVDDVVEVSEDEICRAIVVLLERSKLMVEGAGAAGLAASWRAR